MTQKENEQGGLKASQAEIDKWLDSGVDPELLNNPESTTQQLTDQTRLGEVAIAHLDK